MPSRVGTCSNCWRESQPIIYEASGLARYLPNGHAHVVKNGIEFHRVRR